MTTTYGIVNSYRIHNVTFIEYHTIKNRGVAIYLSNRFVFASDLRTAAFGEALSTYSTLNIMKRTLSRHLPAFSLPELLVVLVIIGILVLIALPNLMPLISRAKSTEAQQQLVFLHTLEKNNFYTYSKYSASLEELGFEQQPLVTDGGHANYRIEIVEASERGFRATATAVVDFDGDGEYNVWEIDQDKNLKETVKD